MGDNTKHYRHSSGLNTKRSLQLLLTALLVGLLGACGLDDGDGLSRLEFTDASQPMQVFQCYRARVRVSGVFDDGAVEDFTQRAKLSSSDPSIVRVSDGSGTAVTPSGITLPAGILSPVGAAGQSATITAKFDNKTQSLQVVIQAGRLELDPPRASIAYGTQMPIRTTAILGNPGDQNRFLANSLVTLSVAEPGDEPLKDPNSLLFIDDDQNAIAGDNSRGPGVSIPLVITASTDVFNADLTGPCATGAARAKFTVRNETLQSLDLALETPRVPENVSQNVAVVGRFSGGFTQNLTNLASLRTSGGDSDTVARVGLQGRTVVTSLDGAQGQSTQVQASYDQGVADSQPVSAQAPLDVTNEHLSALEITPDDAEILPRTALAYTAIGTFTGANNNQRRFALNRDVFWQLQDSASAAAPDPDTVSISNANDAQGTLAAQAGTVDPVTVLAQRTQNPIDETVADDALQASGNLSFNGVLAQLSLDGPPAIGVDQTGQLTSTATLARGDTQNLTPFVIWESSNPEVAAISNSPFTPGRITGLSTGSTQITARYQGASAQFDVTVQSDPVPVPDPPPMPDPEPMDPSPPSPPRPCTLPNPFPSGPRCIIP